MNKPYHLACKKTGLLLQLWGWETRFGPETFAAPTFRPPLSAWHRDFEKCARKSFPRMLKRVPAA